MSPGLRRLALTAHVASSVGWLGAVAALVAISAIGLTSEDPETVRGAYLVLEPAGWFVLVPLAFASLLTGVVQSLIGPWGLFRHYWVVFKLLINTISTTILVLYTGTFASMADVAADPNADLEAVRNASPLVHGTLALVLLLAATTLAVYKPRGLTPFGRRARAVSPTS